MLLLGLGLILLGALAILAGVFVSDPGSGGQLLGFDVDTRSAFLVGVAAGASVLWGISLLRWGARRELAHRRERKELAQLQQKLEQAETRQRTDEGDANADVPPAGERRPDHPPTHQPPNDQRREGDPA